MPDLSPLKFKVAIQDEATEQLNKIEQEFSKLKEKTISVKVEGLSDLQHLLNALQTQQVSNLGKDVGSAINEASRNLQKEAQDAVRVSLGNLAKDLVLIKEAIQHDNFTAFSTRIEKCAQAVNTLDAAFKQFQVTIGADAGMKNFMTGLGEVIRNVRTTMGTLHGSDASQISPDAMSRSFKVAGQEVERLQNVLVRAQRVIETFGDKGFNVASLERYKMALLEVRDNLDLIKKNGGMHPLTGLTASQYISQEDVSRTKSLLNEELSLYRQIGTELERMTKLRNELSDTLNRNPNTSFAADLKNFIAGLDLRMGLVGRLGAQGGLTSMKLNSLFTDDYREQLAAVPQLLKAVANEQKNNAQATKQAQADNDRWAESIRRASIELPKLEMQIKSLQSLEKSSRATGVDTTNLSAKIAELQSLYRILENIAAGAKLHGTAGNFINSAQFQNTVRFANEEASAVRQSAIEKEKAARASQLLSSEEQRLAQALNQTTHAARGQSQVLGDLKSMATQYLGVWGGQQFLHNIIETGGQLEMQRMSIGAILQNTSQANELFSKIKGLATQSPYGVVQLDQMTKQLTAYGFKYNELYDMTKRLADISAATGTDVSRLALALGHVRSEAALSGYTLRQFAMGNVPLLEKLSERLGKTTKEIREMTKKKEIGYDDVVAVLKDLTDEGGMFYNMQEVISESVKAKFKNVRDAMDIMYGEMAEGAPGEALKEVANVLMEVTKNWKDAATILGTGAAVWGVQRAAMLIYTKTLGASTATLWANVRAHQVATAENNLLALSYRNLTLAEKEQIVVGTHNIAGQVRRRIVARLLNVEREKSIAISRKEIISAAAVSLSEKKITVETLARSVATGKLSKVEAALIIKNSTLSASEKSLAIQTIRNVRTFGAFTGVVNGTAMAISRLGMALKGLLLNPMTWIMAGLTAFMELWQRNSSEMEKAADLAEAITERMTEGVKNARQVIKDTSMTFKVDGKADIGNYGIKKGIFSFPSASDISTNQMEESIKVWEEFIKDYSATPNIMLNAAYATKENGDAVHSLAEQYKIMGENAATVMNALPLLKSVSTAIEEGIKDADKGLFDDSLLTDIKQYEKAYKKFYKAISYTIGHHKLEANAALNAAKQNKAFKQAIEEAGISSENTAGQIALLATEQGKYSDAVKNFRKTYDELTQRGASQPFFLTGETVGAWKEVEEEFNEVADNIEKSLTAQGWDFTKKLKPEQIQALAMGLAEAFTQAGSDVDACKEKIMQLCKTRWNVTVDAKTAQAAAEISAIERQLDKLVGHKFSVNIGTSTNFFDVVDNIQKAYKTAREQLNMAPPILLHFGIKMGTAAIGKLSDKEISRLAGGNFLKEMLLKAVQQAQKTVEDSLSFSNAYGVKLEEPKQKGEKKSKSKGGSKADKELENARTRLDLAKKILDEYKKYTKDNRYTSAGAIDIISSLFGVGKGQVSSTVNDYIGTLDKIGNSIKETTEARKKFRQEVDKLKTDTLFDRETETIKRNVDVMKEWLDKMSKQWKLYHDLYKKTGDESFASLAFGEVMDWDDVSQREYARLKELIKERAKADETLKGLIGENGEVGGFSLRMTREAATDIFGGKNADVVELYMKLQELMLKNGETMLEQSADAKEKALTEQEKLNQLYEERKKLVDQLNLLPEDRKEERKGILWQIGAKDKEISKQRWEVFKVEHRWGRVFGDLDNVSFDTLKELIDAMKGFSDTIDGEDVETVKAFQEALKKLVDKKRMLAPLKGITEYINDYKEAAANRSKAQTVYDYKQGMISYAEARRRGLTAEELNISEEEARQNLLDAKDDEVAAINNVIKAVAAFGSQVRQVGESLSQLGNKIGGKGGKILGGFGSILSGTGSSMEALQGIKANASSLSLAMGYATVVTSVATAMYDLNQAVKEVLPNEEKLYKHYARKQKAINDMRAAVEDYRIALAEVKKAEADWLYSNGLSSLRSDAKKNAEVAKAYFDELYEPQEIYRNKKSSWKKHGVAIAIAAAAVVAGALTAGFGAAGVVAAGAVAMGAAATWTTIIAAAAAISVAAAGIAGVVGQFAQAAYDSITYQKGQTAAIENLRIETRRKSTFHGQRTDDLRHWVKEKYGEELFDENGLINIELAENVLENYGHLLQGEAEETVKRLVELAKGMKEFMENVQKYVSEAFAPLVDNMTDALWDWLRDGRDALDSFRSYASDTFMKIAQDAVEAFLNVAIMDKYKETLEGLFAGYGTGQIDTETLLTSVSLIFGQIGQDFKETLPIAQRMMENIRDVGQMQGLDVVNGSTGANDTLSQGIKGVTETTADIIASYMNAVRADVSMNRAMIVNFVTVLWPEYQKSYIDHVTAVSRIDTNVQAIMIMMRDGGGAMYKAISSMESKLANVIDGVESISVR